MKGGKGGRAGSNAPYQAKDRENALGWIASEVVGYSDRWEEGEVQVPYGCWSRAARIAGEKCSVHTAQSWWEGMKDDERLRLLQSAARTRETARAAAAALMQDCITELRMRLLETGRKPTIGDLAVTISTLRGVIDGDRPIGEHITAINLLVDGVPLRVLDHAPPPLQIEGAEEDE